MGYSRFNGPQERRAVFVRSPLGGCSDLYDYCLDDPINLVDPEGLASKKYGGADSAEEQPNLVNKAAGADSAQAQPQPEEADYEAINQKWDNKTCGTIWGLDPGVDKGKEASKILKPGLVTWGKTMKNAGPVVGSVIEELGSDPEAAYVPRGVLKCFWVTE